MKNICNEKISLSNLYLTEFIHRDNLLWSQIFKLFYSTIIVILLPNISGFFNLMLPPIPVLLFRIIGLVMAVAFLYVALGYGKRLEASTETYKNILDSLPDEYQRIDLSKLKFGKLFSLRMSYVVIWFMFVSLIAVDIVFIIWV